MDSELSKFAEHLEIRFDESDAGSGEKRLDRELTLDEHLFFVSGKDFIQAQAMRKAPARVTYRWQMCVLKQAQRMEDAEKEQQLDEELDRFAKENRWLKFPRNFQSIRNRQNLPRRSLTS